MANSGPGYQVWNRSMLLLAGFMGMLAVGATALVGLDLASKRSLEQENDHLDAGADISDPDKGAVPPQDTATGAHQAAAGPDDISDFSVEDDRLVIVFNDLFDPDPTVGLEPDDSDFARTHVTLNGIRIAAVTAAGGLTLDHIGLVAQSSLDTAAAA